MTGERLRPSGFPFVMIGRPLDPRHVSFIDVDNVAVAGFDDLPSSAVSDPAPTTVRQPIRRVGAQAVESLIEVLATGGEPPRHIIMNTQLVIRQSCGANL